MSLDDSGYSGLALEKLSSANVKVGDTVSITQDGEEQIGVLMPRSQVGSDTFHVIIKLSSGYNIGIRLTPETTVLRKKTGKKKRAAQAIT
ncbi:MAG: hypothetical protein ACXAAO_15495, partial [Candidatus Thorarchaeota archaeon]